MRLEYSRWAISFHFPFESKKIVHNDRMEPARGESVTFQTEGGGELVRGSQLKTPDKENENDETVVGAVREFEVER